MPESSISYAKLRDGSWGLRGPGLVAGAKVVVRKRDGTTNEERVGRVLHAADGIVLTTIDQSTKPPRAVRPGRPVCADCGKGGALVEDLEDGLMKHYRCCDIPP